jgi:hypothetical protein
MLYMVLLFMLFPVIALAQATAGPDAGLLEALGKGDYVLAFGLAVMLLTRACTAGPLKDKIPKRFLPWLAVLLGVLSQTSTSLAMGVPWKKAILLGLASGLVAIGGWETLGKYTPVTRKGGAAGLLPLLLPLLLLGAPGCAPSFHGKVSQISTAVGGLRQVSREVYKLRCGKATDECKAVKEAKGYKTLEDCPEWKTCDTQRAEVFAGASSTQMLLDTALVMHGLDKPKDAETLFIQAVAVFENLKEKITKYKLLEVLK